MMIEDFYNKFTGNIKEAEWFATWFDSPYYHILYKNRDDKEAQFFMDNLSEYLKLTTTDKILDLACGKGRHSIYLNQKGFDVTGVDLSEANIKYAKQFENDRLHFDVQDMRESYQKEGFNYIFNLFTSFGYFDSEEENVQVIQASTENLKKGGRLVIDFFNPTRTIENLVKSETKTIEGIEFKISRFVEDGYIVKDICFEHQGHDFEYQEKVKAIPEQEFLHYFERGELKLLEIFGGYHLEPFNEHQSERMIFILEK